MRDNSERRHEIKKILLNNLMLTDDQKLTAGYNGRITLWGAGDGVIQTFLLGVSKKEVEYDNLLSNHRQVLYQAQEAMKNLGRQLFVASVPDAPAVLIRHVFFRPVVLILEEIQTEDDGKKLVLSAYCGRAIMTFFSVSYCIREFEKQMDGKLRRKNKKEKNTET